MYNLRVKGKLFTMRYIKKVCPFLLLSILFTTSCSVNKNYDVLKMIKIATDNTPFYADFINEKELYHDGGNMEFNKSINISLPSKYDLREKGIIGKAKDQGSDGTCWSFASSTTIEASYLGQNNITQEQYKNKYGDYLTLSPLYNAYFASHYFGYDDITNYNERWENQKGEGQYILGGVKDKYYVNLGGYPLYTVNNMANLTGLNYENDYPYESKDNYVQGNARFKHEFELNSYSSLPSPYYFSINGEAIFRESALNLIKSKIVDNYAIEAAIYYGSESSSNYNKYFPTFKKILLETKGVDKYTETQINDATNLMLGKLNNITSTDLTPVFEIVSLYEHGNIEEESILDVKQRYYYELTFCLATYSQYCFTETISNHEIVIVGYDDNYSKDNFALTPPGDGAFIALNSWGEQWGYDGYFYISYYDCSLSDLGVYDVIKDNTRDVSNLYSYNLGTATHLMSIPTKEDIQVANIFTMEKDSILDYASIDIALQDSDVTYAVYKLNDNYKTPTDGNLLTKFNKYYEYYGYYREKIEDIKVNKGDAISIVIEQKSSYHLASENSLLVVPLGYKTAYYEREEMALDDKNWPCSEDNYIVNKGESYIGYKNSWCDFIDLKDYFEINNPCYTINNPPIRLYTKDC